MIEKIIYILLFLLVVIYFLRFGILHLLNYIPTNDGIDIVLFSFMRIYKIRYEQIDSCEAQSVFAFNFESDGTGALSLFFRSLTLGGRPALKSVRLRLKRGFFRYIFLSPEQRDEFVGYVNRHLGHLENRPK
jgi:hypothetical protein